PAVPPGRPSGPIPPGQTGGPPAVRPPSPPGSRVGPAGQRTPPTSAPAARSAQQTAQSGERQIGPQGGPGAGAAGRPGAASGSERHGPSCEELRKSARFNILFEKVDIEKLIQTVADATCKTFILPETVRGKISIIGPENGRAQVDADQFYAA